MPMSIANNNFNIYRPLPKKNQNHNNLSKPKTKLITAENKKCVPDPACCGATTTIGGGSAATFASAYSLFAILN